MAKLTQTQIALLKQGHAHAGRIYFATYIERRGRYHHSVVGGRQLQAAEGLVRLGLLAEGRTRPGSTYERSGNGYRQVRWADHDYAITEAGREAIAALQEASRR